MTSCKTAPTSFCIAQLDDVRCARLQDLYSRGLAYAAGSGKRLACLWVVGASRWPRLAEAFVGLVWEHDALAKLDRTLHSRGRNCLGMKISGAKCFGPASIKMSQTWEVFGLPRYDPCLGQQPRPMLVRHPSAKLGALLPNIVHMTLIVTTTMHLSWLASEGQCGSVTPLLYTPEDL